jgi:hypothetical protein
MRTSRRLTAANAPGNGALRAALDQFISALSSHSSERRWFRFLRPFLDRPLTYEERTALARRLGYKSTGGFYGTNERSTRCLWLGPDFLSRLTPAGEDYVRRMIVDNPDWEEEFAAS